MVIQMVNSMRQVTVAEAIAELVPRQSVRDLLPQLHALREALPLQVASGVDTIRALRDEDAAPATASPRL
jgi:hypothetical protein